MIFDGATVHRHTGVGIVICLSVLELTGASS